MIIFSPNRFPVLHNGYYLYNGNGYTNRDMLAESMIESRHFSNVSFYFHDDIFSKLDWTKEPLENIEDLYKQRAVQLREKYKYLILSYSGGSDSQQILDVFLKHNIFLDEIQTINWNKITNKLDKNAIYRDESIYHLLEYDINVVPNLNKVRKISPNTKITVLDTSDFLINDVVSGNFEMIGIKNLGAYRALYVPSPRSWTITQNYHMNETCSKDGIAIIQGVEKPHFNERDGKCYFRFSDAGYYCEKFINNGLIDNVYRSEYFYWSPDFPKIVLKQAHLLRNRINCDKKFFSLLKTVESKTKKHIDSKDIKAVAYYDLDNYITPIIYPNSRVIQEFNKPLKIGPEYMILSKYHGMGSRIAAGMKEALDFRMKKYSLIGQQLKTSLIFSQSYCVGDFMPSWND